MKKITKILCLTLAMLMVMGTSVFAAEYKVLPVHENFSSLVFGTARANNIANSSQTSYYDGAIEDLSQVHKGSDSTGGSQHLNIKNALGLGGKSIDDHSFHVGLRTKDFAGAALPKLITYFGTLDESEQIISGTYSDLVHEFDFITLGDGGNLINIYGKNSGGNSTTKAVIVDNKIASHFLDSNGTAVDFTFEKGKWYHIAVAYSSGEDKVKIYVNGQEKGYFEATKYLTSLVSSYIEYRTDAPSVAEDATEDEIAAELAKYQFAIDNIEIYSGTYDNTNDIVTVSSENDDIVISNDKITVPVGTTVSELTNSLTEASGGTIRVYESLAATSEVVAYSSSTPAVSKAFATNKVLESDNLVVVENATWEDYGNSYAYYTIEVADGFVAKQNGETVSNLSNKANDIVFGYAETNANEDRVLLVGVYNAAGDLVDVVMNEDGVVLFGEGQETITATVPASSLAGLTTGAKVKAFVWKDLADIVPTGEEITLTYNAQ